MIKILIFISLFYCIFARGLDSCRHEDVMKSTFGNNYLEKYHSSLNNIRNIIGNRTHTRMLTEIRIPVVWHILTDGPSNLVSMDTVNLEMQYLNEWFSATNNHYGSASSFWDSVRAVADDFHLTFELAAYDLNGNPFNGVNVVSGSSIASNCDAPHIFRTSSGGVNIWDPKKFYNIYTCEIAGGALGFSYLPDGPDTHPFDGTVLDVRSGQLGNSEYSGSTISHETGHWLGLPHTFEGCSGPGDGIADTPPTDAPAFDYNNGLCPPSEPDSTFQRCGNIVMVQNNMDYNFEPCLCFFSKDQVEVMRGWLEAPLSESARGALGVSPALQQSCQTFDCVNKECGDDGCGGSCGSCTSSQDCISNQCEFTNSPNAECSGAIEIPFLESPGSTVSGDNTELYSPVDSCEPEFHRYPLFYTFTPSFSATASIYTDSQFLDTTLSVFSGSCGSLSCVAFNDDINYYSSILTSRVDISVSSGTTYYVVVSGWQTEQGPFSLTIEASEQTCTPQCDGKDCGSDGCGSQCGSCQSNEFCNTQDLCEEIVTNNDECFGATSVTGGTVLSDENNVLASIDNLSCGSRVTWAVWYVFVGTGNQITVDTCSDLRFDTLIHVFSGNCNSLTCIGTSDDTCANSLGASLSFCSNSGTEYFIAVDGYNARLGEFALTITDTLVSCSSKSLIVRDEQSVNYQYLTPKEISSVNTRDILAVNEQCSTATDLNGLGFPSSTVVLTASTKSSNVPFDVACTSSQSRGLWYSFTGTGSMVHIDTCTPTSDPYESIIHVISGSCSSPECQAYSSNTNSPSTCGSGGDTVFCTNNGAPYWIYVEGKNLQQGEFIMTVYNTELSCIEPSNSECSSAQTISEGVPVTVVHKDYPPSSVLDCDLVGSPDVASIISNVAWYRFVASSSNQYTVDICSDLVGDFAINVYEGTSCSNAACFGTTSNGASCGSQNRKQFCTQAGNTYFISIYAGYGSFTFTLNSNGACQLSCVPVCASGSLCTGDTCGGSCGTCIGTCVNEQCISDPNPSSSNTPAPFSPSNSPAAPSASNSPAAPSASNSPGSPPSNSPVAASASNSPAAPSASNSPAAPSASNSPDSFSSFSTFTTFSSFTSLFSTFTSFFSSFTSIFTTFTSFTSFSTFSTTTVSSSSSSSSSSIASTLAVSSLIVIISPIIALF